MRNPLTLLLISSCLFGATINVPADYPTIQEGIDAAADGDAVHVAAGEYVLTEPINFNRLHDPEDSESPDFKNITVSGAGAETTIIKMGDNPADPGRTSVVIFEHGETEETVLEDVTLMGAGGTRWGSESWQDGGGGILCINGCSPSVLRCIITGSLRGEYGGGVFIHASSPVFTDCTITRNIADEDGGGLYCRASSPVFTNCIISENESDEDGGGLFLHSSSPEFHQCTITGNKDWGVYCVSDVFPFLSRCTIAGNSDGGVFCDDSKAVLVNCLIIGNEGHGVICVNDASPRLAHCTIAGNSMGEGFGIVSLVSSKPIVINCILWNNPGGAIHYQDEDATPNISFSCIEGGGDPWPGEGNINADPVFKKEGIFDFDRRKMVELGGYIIDVPDFIVDPGDYGLQEGSPCIDSGDPEVAYEFDLAGNARSCGAGDDLGAYEMGDCSPEYSFIRGELNGDGKLDLADAIYGLSFLFSDGGPPLCMDAADANDDGKVDLADSISILTYLYGEGYSLPAPFPGCGMDPSLDELDCVASHCVN